MSTSHYMHMPVAKAGREEDVVHVSDVFQNPISSMLIEYQTNLNRQKNKKAWPLCVEIYSIWKKCNVKEVAKLHVFYFKWVNITNPSMLVVFTQHLWKCNMCSLVFQRALRTHNEILKLCYFTHF